MKLSDDQLYLMKHGMKFEDVKDMSADDLRDNVRRMKALDQKALPPLPPGLKTKKSMGCIPAFGLFALGLFVLIIVLAQIDPPKDRATETTATTSAVMAPKTAPAPPTERIVKISVLQLHDDYEANEVATDERHKGKITDVSGKVQAIDKDVWGNMIVALRARNQFMPANMYMDESEKSAVQRLSKGMSVTVRCSKVNRWVGVPNGHSCTLVSK